ncbi:hypothetical protein [Pseudorhizobium xiangyangii]|nr:hypothetical protein [Neorhizobium xiangyangii]
MPRSRAWKVADTDTGWGLFHIYRVTDLSITNGKFPKAAAGY